MCTASLIALGDAAWRFAFNRDELRSRVPAEPPQQRSVDGIPCAWPVDGAAGGTWIAASARGVVLALLNRNADDAGSWRRAAAARSRGGLIPELIAAADVDAAIARLASCELTPFAPFVLLAIDDQRVACATWDAARLTSVVDPRGPARMWASSGYGDERVRGPRAAVFAAVAADPRTVTQDAFHAGRVGDDGVAWVAMRRDDARSVSRTVIAVDRRRVAMRYAPLDEDGVEGAVSELVLERTA